RNANVKTNQRKIFPAKLRCLFFITVTALSIVGRSGNAAVPVFTHMGDAPPQYDRIFINRHGQMATPLRFYTQEHDTYGILQYSPSAGTQIQMLPSDSRIFWTRWSNAGAALYADYTHKVYRLPIGGNYTEIFDNYFLTG